MWHLTPEEKDFILALSGQKTMTDEERDALIMAAILIWYFRPQIKRVTNWLWTKFVWYFKTVTFRSLRNDLTRDGSINGPLQAEAPVSKPSL